MNGKKLGLALVGFSFLAVAEPAPEYTEIHFSTSPGPGVLAVTVLSREKNIWRLFPEEVKIEHTKKSMEYSLSYDNQKPLQSLLLAASDKKETTPECKAELKALLSPPTTAIADDKITTTVYIALEEEHPERLTVRMKGDLKILSAEPLTAAGSLDTGDKPEMQPWTRAVYLNLAYSAGYGINYGISDLVVKEGATKGTYQIEPQKTGLATIKSFIADGLITGLCAEALDQDYWAPYVDKSEVKNRFHKSIVVVIPMPKEVPTKLDLQTSPEFSVKALKALD